MMGRRKLACVALAGAVVCSAVGAAGAAAAGWTAGGLKYVQQTKTMAPIGEGLVGKQAETDCNGELLRWRSAGAGTRLLGLTSPHTAFVRQIGSLNGLSFAFGAQSAAGGGSPKVRAIGICRRVKHGRGQRGNSTENYEAGVASVKVSCPSKGSWHVTGGGSAMAYNADLIASHPVDGNDADLKPDDGWKTTVLAHEAGGPGLEIRAYAHCIREVARRAWSVPLSRKRTETLAQGETKTVSQRCPRGTFASGGGLKLSSPSYAARMLGAFPYDSPDKGTVPEDGFRGHATYPPGGAALPPIEMTVHTICTRKLPRSQEY